MSFTTLGSATILALRKGMLEDQQTEMVVGMKVRDVDMGEVFAHGNDVGDHPVRVAEQLGCVDQNCIPFAVDER